MSSGSQNPKSNEPVPPKPIDLSKLTQAKIEFNPVTKPFEHDGEDPDSSI
jgi:hypothetical protein